MQLSWVPWSQGFSYDCSHGWLGLRFPMKGMQQGSVGGRIQFPRPRASAWHWLLAECLAQFHSRGGSRQGSTQEGSQLPSEVLRRACQAGPASLGNGLLEVASVLFIARHWVQPPQKGRRLYKGISTSRWGLLEAA